MVKISVYSLHQRSDGIVASKVLDHLRAMSNFDGYAVYLFRVASL